MPWEVSVTPDGAAAIANPQGKIGESGEGAVNGCAWLWQWPCGRDHKRLGFDAHRTQQEGGEVGGVGLFRARASRRRGTPRSCILDMRDGGSPISPPMVMAAAAMGRPWRLLRRGVGPGGSIHPRDRLSDQLLN